ncbi:Fluconazole resistance protein 1-like protein 1 [Seiridium cupressi]
MDKGLPTPPQEDNLKVVTGARRNTSSSTKSVKPVHRNSKRASQASHSPVHDHAPLSPHGSNMDRHKRVWKACERCRQKKTKCDGEFPCKRCKDDGLVCTAGTRKKTEYKQLPRGYAEVLENTQLTLIATVHKLYSMVRTGQQWDLGEPELNDRGQPIIHNIATVLGCIRPNADADLPPHSIFPEDEGGLGKLAAELEAQQMDHDSHMVSIKSETDSTCNRTERASSSELDHSDFEQDYRKTMMSNQNMQTLSPQSFTSYNDFDTSTIPSELDPATMFPVQSTSNPSSFPSWNMARPTSMNSIPPQFMQQMDMNMADIMLSQGLVESEFGTIKPHILSCPNPEVMLGVGDPMIYSGYSMDALRT